MYMDDMRDLNVLPADVYPRATHEVPEMIEIIERLIEKGYAYPAASEQSEWSDVYYRVSAKEDYGKLSHRTQDSLLAGARVESGEQKENAADFALWKGAKAGEPSWDSPWGKGRPGWHIECSAMSLKYLGEQIDIHGGGEDLIFPHHENEIAQTEAFTGRRSVRAHLAAQRLGEDGRREDEQVARQLHHHPRRAEQGGRRRAAPLGAHIALPQAADVQRRHARRREGGRGPSADRRARARRRDGDGGIDRGRVPRALHRRDGRRPQHAASARRSVRSRQGNQSRARRGARRRGGAGAAHRAGGRARSAARARASSPSRRRRSSICWCRSAPSCAPPSSGSSRTACATASPSSNVVLEDGPQGTTWKPA